MNMLHNTNILFVSLLFGKLVRQTTNDHLLSNAYVSILQEAELDESSLLSLSVPGDVAKKLLHYLKEKLPSSCLSDLLCSHAFSKHYLRRGGGCLEDEDLMGEDTTSTCMCPHQTA